jgi:hypothetical protein
LNAARRIRTWFRVVLPIENVVGVALLCDWLFYAAWMIFEGAATRTPGTFQAWEGLSLLNLALYGIFRGTAFHPLFYKTYRTWLKNSPWTSRLPLPFGPVQLVVQDAIVVALLVALCMLRNAGTHPAWMVLAFLIPCLLRLAESVATLGAVWYAYAAAFGIGLAFRLREWPWWSLGVALVVYGILDAGVRRTLARFHEWNFDWIDEHPSMGFNDPSVRQRREQRSTSLGWPLDRLSPCLTIPSIRYRDGYLISVLTGWWTYLTYQLFPWVDASPEASLLIQRMVVPMVPSTIAIFRIGKYMLGYLPPISLLGRIASGRLIIPGYDKIFVAPLLALLLTIGGPHLLAQFAVPPSIAVFLLSAVATAIALNLGPTLQSWQLTGKHRMVPMAWLYGNQRAV